MRHTIQLPANTPTRILIKLSRQLAGLDLDDVAEQLGISRRTYERIEAGDRIAGPDELEALAELTGQNVALFETSATDERAASGRVLHRSRRQRKTPRRRAA